MTDRLLRCDESRTRIGHIEWALKKAEEFPGIETYSHCHSGSVRRSCGKFPAADCEIPAIIRRRYMWLRSLLCVRRWSLHRPNEASLKNNIPIPHGLLRVGGVLTHDIFDQAGKLLLRKGAHLESDAIVERLEGAGFFDPEALDALKGAASAADHPVPTGYIPDRTGAPYCVFAELDAACERLQALFADGSTDLEDGVMAAAATIQQCCLVDSDASIASILLAAHPHGVRHCVNVATLAALLLMRQKHDAARLQQAILAALTMNIGSPDADGSAFDVARDPADERSVMVRKHPVASVETLLARRVRSPLWLAVVSQHHETLDGSGYPTGLHGAAILPEAQVVALADRYCSMIAGQAGRPQVLVTQALKDLHGHHGKEYAPALIGALIASLGIYPPGTYVQLANREIAVVAHRLLDPKHPIVYAICGPSGVAYSPPRKRLTTDQAGHAIEHCLARQDVLVALVPQEVWPPTITAAKPSIPKLHAVAENAAQPGG